MKFLPLCRTDDNIILGGFVLSDWLIFFVCRPSPQLQSLFLLVYQLRSKLVSYRQSYSSYATIPASPEARSKRVSTDEEGPESSSAQGGMSGLQPQTEGLNDSSETIDLDREHRESDGKEKYVVHLSLAFDPSALHATVTPQGFVSVYVCSCVHICVARGVLMYNIKNNNQNKDETHGLR